MTIDHLFPEYLLYSHKSFITIKKIYSLKKEFCINDFANWVPAHETCNNKKGNFMPLFSTDFAMVNKLSDVARNAYDLLLKQQTEDEELAKLLTHLGNGSINTSGLYKLIEKTTILQFKFSEEGVSKERDDADNPVI